MDVYAAGKAHTLIHSIDGGLNWMGLTTGTAADLVCVWGSSSTDVYVVGTVGTILHSGNGTNWVPQASNTIARLNTVWGTGPGDVFAAGDGGTILHLQ
jgi:photosystem II stability/assembly factor-like uncharacterized protein